jgi:hypothetical protein
MAAEVADAGVEDIVECVFTKEDVADDPHHSSEHRVCPQSSQICYRVDYLLLHPHALQEILVI